MLGRHRWELHILLLFFGVLYWSFGTATCHAQDKSDDIKKLMKERRDFLRDALDQMTKLYLARSGIVTLQELIQADRDLLKADLDWFDKPGDRIKAIEKRKETADSYLNMAEVKVAAARGTKATVLQAKAYVLEVEIELLKEKEKQKAKPGK